MTLRRRSQGEPTASRLATGAGNRYDYWRVAVDAWREHPLTGVGAGGYDKPYFAHRTTAEDIRQPHSLPLQVLAELGIVGGAAARGRPARDRAPARGGGSAPAAASRSSSRRSAS